MATEGGLRVENVGYTYSRGGAYALDGVGFHAAAGQFTALLGPNGAGKTTLMALITRLFQSRTGRIEIAGFDLKLAPRQALSRMGVVFQRPTLDLELTVEQNLVYAARLYGLDRRLGEARIDENLARLDMTERRRDAVRQLSGGMRRRVELARALLHRPDILILDEPTVGLDIPSRMAITRYVHELCQERGLAALWTTHLIDEVWPDDHAVILAGGRVRADGSVAQIIAEAQADDLAEAYDWLCQRGGVAA